MKKIKSGTPLWSNSPSAGQEMLYGKEVKKKIKDRYDKENLNENKKV